VRNRRAIALLRVSSNAQDNARQRTHIEWLKKHFGLEIVETIELDGVSGRKVLQDRRFQQVLHDLRHRADIDGLALSAIDRFFRTDRYDDTRCFQPLADARKLIWSKVEGEVDPSTPEGFSICMTAALKSGTEWRTLRDRTMDGKEELRAEGRHVNGDASLPRGIHYDKATGKWSYQEPDCSRVARMFPLFLDGWSLNRIAQEVGGGWTHKGVTDALRNRIWAFGERVYPANSRREEPLVVKVIDKPLISPAIWQEVNDRLKSGAKSWRETRRPTKPLLGGMLRCPCGKACYRRAASRPTGYDTYACASTHGRGPSCGNKRVKRELVDGAVFRMIREQFRNPYVLPLLVDAIERRTLKAPARDQQTAKERSRLESKRERILEQRTDGHITREQCNERVAAVDRELAALRIEMPVAEPKVDTVKLAAALQKHFEGFEKWDLERQRKLLQWAIGDIVLNPKGIDTITLKGGFLVEAARMETTIRDAVDSANGVNLGSHSRLLC
jgi:hypothetical protein